MICKEFQAISPFELEEREYIEVIEIFADLRDMQIRDEQKNPEKYQSEPKDQKSQKGKEKVIRRPASDLWF